MSPEQSPDWAAAQVVSFDIFDTLLARRCAAPEDVFLMLEQIWRERGGEVYAGFAERRRRIDGAARREAWEQRQSEEIELADIYRLLKAEQPQWAATVEAMVALEMELESSLLYPLPGAQQWIEAALAAGKRVIVISDMYLPQAFCDDRLQANGIRGYERLYVSSAVGKLKHTGNLFRHVIADMGVEPGKILHVGDNAHSDGKQARACGIRSWIVPKVVEALPRLSQHPLLKRTAPQGAADVALALEQSLLCGLSARGLRRESDFADPFWYRIGYQFGGPLLYGYVRFIMDQVRDRGIKKVFFLSRDGYILKQVYDVLRDADAAAAQSLPESDYVYASRRALNFAAIRALTPKHEDWLAEGIRLTVGDFLQRIGLDPADFAEPIRTCGFTGAAHPVVGGHEYEQLRQLYRLIEPDLVAAAGREREAYIAYLREKGLLDAGPLVLVDVGWMTSIQHSFAAMLHELEPELEIEGYYLGSYPEARARSNARSRHRHYLMAYGEPEAAMRTIRHCVGLVEFFFAAPEPTFLSMRREADGSLLPQFAPFHENARDLPALAMLHEGILEYVGHAAAIGKTYPFRVSPDWVLAFLHRLLAEPTREEANRLGDIQYADGYGAYFHHTQMAEAVDLRVFGLNKQRWKRAFKQSHWPKGFVMRLSPLGRWLFRRLHPRARFDKSYG